VCGRPEGLHYIIEAVPYIPGERAVDECIRRDRTNTGPDDRQEVVSKLRV